MQELEPLREILEGVFRVIAAHLAEDIQADHLGAAVNFLFAQEELVEGEPRDRARVSRVGRIAVTALGIHEDNLPKAHRVFGVLSQVTRLRLEPSRRHHVVGSERAEIPPPRKRQEFVHRGHKSLVFAVDVSKVQFFMQALENLWRGIRAAVVDDDELEGYALLRHHGTHRRLHVLFVVVARHEHRDNRGEFTLFRFGTLHEGLHVDIFLYLLGKHVRYGVFHLSLPTDMASATNVTKFSTA